MTVADLIKELQKLPQDAKVLARNVDTFEHYVTDVTLFNSDDHVLIDASDGEEYMGQDEPEDEDDEDEDEEGESNGQQG